MTKRCRLAVGRRAAVLGLLLALAACSGGNGGPEEPVLPVVTTEGSQRVSAAEETVTGSVQTNGKETEYWFEWATDEAFTNSTATPVNVLAASSAPQAVSGSLGGLPRGAKIYYRLCARNDDGEVEGEVKACFHYANVAFLTSVEGTGNLGAWAEAGGATGLAAGDAICQSLAGNAGLPGTFKAWLSDSAVAARDRLARSKEVYLGVDGARLASGWAALTSAACVDGSGRCLEHPISVDERGVPAGSHLVYTDTRTDASKGVPIFGNACRNWTSPNVADEAAAGSSSSSNWAWTEAGISPCHFTHRLYCFQQNVDLPQEAYRTGCPGPWGWIWYVSACSKLAQGPECPYVCCNFWRVSPYCRTIPATVGGYTITSCSYDTGLYHMAVTHAGEPFTVTCEVR